MITRSNKRAVVYNRGIRAMILDREEELCVGDMIMVVRNNYYWTEQERRPTPQAGSSAPAPALYGQGPFCTQRHRMGWTGSLPRPNP